MIDNLNTISDIIASNDTSNLTVEQITVLTTKIQDLFTTFANNTISFLNSIYWKFQHNKLFRLPYSPLHIIFYCFIFFIHPFNFL